MDYSTEDIVNAYKSNRLEYIRADKTDGNLQKVALTILQDPVIQALSAPTMLLPKGPKEVDSYIDSVVNSLLGVAICLREDDDNDKTEVKEKKPRTIIGVMCIGWGGISPTVAHHRTAEIGISLIKEHQGKGYGREAINWMVDWGFCHAGLHTIGITTTNYNPRGVYLYENIGFRLEGRRRDTIWMNRKWYDLIEFGMTEDEWESLRGLDMKEK
jgi:RimJ/RimL family protein N-acetyltransferase